jgi:hypothetical protein
MPGPGADGGGAVDSAAKDGGKGGADGGSSGGQDGGASSADGSASGADGASSGSDGSVGGNDASGGGDAKAGTDGGSGGGDAGGGDAGGGSDAAAQPDGSAGGTDASGASDAAQGACTPGTYQCDPGNVVVICNASGTAWLYSSTCTVGCTGGLCTGQCNPGDVRCNGGNAETCNSSGTAWTVQQMCSGTCTAGACDLVGLDVAGNQNLDGEIWVDGAVDVHSGATLNSPTGNLTLHATSITVENGGSIAVAPTGATAAGKGANGGDFYNAAGGSYGTGSLAFGSSVDAVVQPGAAGGAGVGAAAGTGGGVLRLYAKTIVIAGQVTANGAGGVSAYVGGGGGSGGGILVAGDSVTISGSVSAAGGSGAGSAYIGGNGGSGRVKVLYGGSHSITGTLTGTVTQGLLPPVGITSTSHPSSALVYNDNFASLDLSWSKAFASSQGYYVILDTTPVHVPTPAAGVAFISNDFISFPPGAVTQGANYFHIAPVDASSAVGTVEGTFEVQINASAPSLSSSSHPDPTKWVANQNAYFAWTFPQGDANVAGAYYVLDAFGSTVPTNAATFLPVTQKQILLSNLASGIWVMHVVSVDQRGYLTKAGANYRVNIGTDPGSGGVLGQIVDSMGQPVAGASVTINRGLYTQTTNSTGNYNFMTIPAGSFELDVSATGHMPSVKSITVVANSPTTANVTLP